MAVMAVEIFLHHEEVALMANSAIIVVIIRMATVESATNRPTPTAKTLVVPMVRETTVIHVAVLMTVALVAEMIDMIVAAIGMVMLPANQATG